MSIKLMSAIFETEFPDTLGDGQGGKVRASTAKLVLLAIADHANDFGESAYPGLTLLEKKTGLSRQGIIDAISALKFNGLMSVSDEPSRLGTNNYTIILAAYPCLVHRVDQYTGLTSGSQQCVPGVVNTVDHNHQLTINESSSEPTSKEEEPKPVTPQVGRKKLALPPGSDLSWSVLDNTDDWKRAKIEGDRRAAPLIAVIEGLSKLNPNWPKHGENKEWDRVARLISIEVENENGTVDGFVKWVNRQKDRTQRIQWYGRKPGNVWEDWPLAFEPEPEEHHYPTVQELEAEGKI